MIPVFVCFVRVSIVGYVWDVSKGDMVELSW